MSNHAPYPWGVDLELDGRLMHAETYILPDNRLGSPGEPVRLSPVKFDLSTFKRSPKRIDAWVTRYGKRIAKIPLEDLEGAVASMFSRWGTPGTLDITQIQLMISGT